jgi:hypothetical protein
MEQKATRKSDTHIKTPQRCCQSLMRIVKLCFTTISLSLHLMDVPAPQLVRDVEQLHRHNDKPQRIWGVCPFKTKENGFVCERLMDIASSNGEYAVT